MNTLTSAKSDLSNAFKQIAQRLVNGENNFIEVLMDLGGISKVEAEKVSALYRKLKLVKRDAASGVISVKDGMFLDKDIIANAVAA